MRRPIVASVEGIFAAPSTGDHLITAADPLPDDLRQAIEAINASPCMCTSLAEVRLDQGGTATRRRAVTVLARLNTHGHVLDLRPSPADATLWHAGRPVRAGSGHGRRDHRRGIAGQAGLPAVPGRGWRVVSPLQAPSAGPRVTHPRWARLPERPGRPPAPGDPAA